MIRVSTFLVLLSPTRSNSPSCKTRSSFTWSLGEVLLISSRKMLPACAASNRPVRLSTAPVNEPLTCPNSSLSSRLSVRAPQLTRMYGPVDRGLRSWTARATSSLPVPVSPTIRTQARDGATRRVVRHHLLQGRAAADDARQGGIVADAPRLRFVAAPARRGSSSGQGAWASRPSSGDHRVAPGCDAGAAEAWPCLEPDRGSGRLSAATTAARAVMDARVGLRRPRCRRAGPPAGG